MAFLCNGLQYIVQDCRGLVDPNALDVVIKNKIMIFCRVYDVDKVYQRGEAPPFYDQCYLRECLFSLVA